MGNSLPSNGHIKVGSNTTITFKKLERKEIADGGRREIWMVRYMVDDSIVGLDFHRVFDKDGDVKTLRFQFSDSRRKGEVIFFFIDKSDNDLLDQIKFEKFGKFYDTTFDNEIFDTWGFLTKTNAFFHSSGRGLLIIEQKSIHRSMKPYNVTVAHYYAVCSGSDIGLSIIVDISVSNNNLVVSVEGPVQHPSSSLLLMFQQVSRTRIWKRTTIIETQRHLCSRMKEMIENDPDTDTECESDEDTNYLQSTQLPYSRQNERSVLSNQGAVRGNYNGNIYLNQYFYR